MLKQYTSPVCSCIFCRKTFSQKGIDSHYITKHTEIGNNRVRENGYIASLVIKKSTIRAKQKRIDYLLTPNLCLCCKTPLDYDSRHSRYCSHSCAATITNKTRIISKPRKKITFPQKTSIKFCTCKYCDTRYIWNSVTKGSKVFCSILCSSKSKSEHASIHFKKIGAGGVRPSKKIEYNGVKLGSSYEVKLAMLLDELHIKWVQPNKMSYLKPDGSKSTYLADFYLPEYLLYLDPKNDFLINNINPGNGLKDIDKIAFVVEQNNCMVAVIDYEHISKGFIIKLTKHTRIEPTVILSFKESCFDYLHRCSILYL